VHTLVFKGRIRDTSSMSSKTAGAKPAGYPRAWCAGSTGSTRCNRCLSGSGVQLPFGHKKLINGTINLLYHIGECANAEPFNEYRNFAVMRGCSHDVKLRFDYKGRLVTIKRAT